MNQKGNWLGLQSRKKLTALRSLGEGFKDCMSIMGDELVGTRELETINVTCGIITAVDVNAKVLDPQ